MYYSLMKVACMSDIISTKSREKVWPQKVQTFEVEENDGWGRKPYPVMAMYEDIVGTQQELKPMCGA